MYKKIIVKYNTIKYKYIKMIKHQYKIFVKICGNNQLNIKKVGVGQWKEDLQIIVLTIHIIIHIIA